MLPALAKHNIVAASVRGRSQCGFGIAQHTRTMLPDVARARGRDRGTRQPSVAVIGQAAGSCFARAEICAAGPVRSQLATSRLLLRQPCPHPATACPQPAKADAASPPCRPSPRSFAWSGTSRRKPRAAPSAHSLRSATSWTVWLSAFSRMRSARWRVGRMLSCRLTRLIRVQIAVAVSTASLSVSRE